MSEKHDLPWSRNGMNVMDTNGKPVATTDAAYMLASSRDAEERATFIVHCVNSHAELVEACKAMLAELDELERTNAPCIPSLGACDKMRAALRKAGVEQ